MPSLSGQERPGWQVLAQQVFFAPRRFPRGTLSMDAWDGYPAARQRVLDMFHDRRDGVLSHSLLVLLRLLCLERSS